MCTDRLASACFSLGIGLGLALGVAPPLHAQLAAPAFEEAPEQLGPNRWRLTWKSESGAEYRLERSFDLESWEPVDTLAATGGSSSLIDSGLANEEKVFWRVVLLNDEGGLAAALRLVDVSPDPANLDHWQVTWESEAGVGYRLERSFNLHVWEAVGTITGLANFTSMFDTEVAGQPQVFWRVVVEGGTGSPLTVSDVSVQYHADGANSSVTYNLVAGGTETVNNVVVFDEGVEIGTAVRGHGDTWTLTLDWDSALPEVHRIEAEVSTEEGSVERSAMRGVLLADPEFFIALAPTGELLQGQLIAVAADGRLGDFRYYPEGNGNLATGTGVYFEFPAGAQLDTGGATPELTFTAGKFFRGPLDENPAEVTTGQRTLDLGNVTPDEVRPAFSLPAGPIALDWGSGSVRWESGPLEPGGWSNLQVELPIGDFGLPGGRLNATVGAHPVTGVLYLTVCYFGEWTPGPGGPVFRIPEADPLKIYYTKVGGLAAHGTAEAEFPTGAKVRGTLSWVYPHFEFRFEGKGIVIPTLDSLTGLLPADPSACAPAGESTAELDVFAQCLEGYRHTFRGLAAGGAGQAETAAAAAEVSAPLPSPTDPAGAALEAWMGRILSWQGDRAGQILSEPQLQDLTAVVEQAAKTGEGAHELPTVLKLLRDLLVLTEPLEEVRGPGASSDALAGAVALAGERLLATAERLVAEKQITSISQDVKSAADLLLEIDLLIEKLDAVPPVPGGPAPGATISSYRRRYDRLSLTYSNGMDRVIWETLNIQPADFNGNDNNILLAKDEEELLAVLDNVLGALKVLRTKGFRDLRVSQAGSGPDSPPLHEAWRQIQNVFDAKHETASRAALLGNDLARVRRALALRARYFELHNLLGEILASDDSDLQPLTHLLVDKYTALQSRLPGVVQAVTCVGDSAVLSRIQEHTIDMATNQDLQLKFDQAEACRVFLAQRNGAQIDCDPVYLELAKDSLQVANPPIAGDSERTVRVTGRYEDTGSSGSPLTMQLNQAGRLLLGWAQTHQIHPGTSNRVTITQRVIGMLKSETGTTAEFYVLFRKDDGSFLGSKTEDKRLFVATKTTAGVDLQDKPLPGTLSGIGDLPPATIDYVKTTNFPAFSTLLTDLFAENHEARDVFLAQQHAPLHSRQIAKVRGHYATILADLENYLAAGPAARAGIAQTMGRHLKNLTLEVSDHQIPLARQIMREMLSRSVATDPPVPDPEEPLIKLSHWNWVRVIFARHNSQSPVFDEFRKFMGPEISNDYSGQSFKYTVRITDASAGVSVGIADLGIGVIGIEMTKSRADGTGQSAELNLIGSMGQAGAGWTPKRLDDLNEFGAGGGGGGASFEVFSDIDYSESSLGGPLMVIGASAGVGAGVKDVVVGPSILVLYGDFSLPPFALPLPLVNFDNNVRLPSIEMNFGLGAVKPASPNEVVSANAFALSTEPKDQSFTAEAGIVGAVHFDVGSPDLRPCGDAELRTLVAEMRTIFESKTGTVSILGFTDATGIEGNSSAENDAFNDALSQGRADTVKAALIALVGEGLEVTGDRLRAIGLGRRPSMGLTSPKEGMLNEAEQAFLAQKKLNSPTLVDGQASQDWRTVTILLNNLVSIDLGSEGTATNP